VQDEDDQTAEPAAAEPVDDRASHDAQQNSGQFVPDGIPDDRGPAAYFAELLGTFILVFLITAAVSLYVLPAVPAGPGLPPVQPFIDFSVIGLVHVFVLFLLIHSLAAISGAHFNPAVTIALTFLREVKVRDAGIYIAMQIIGAVLGALLTKALLTDEGEGSQYGSTLVTDRLSDGTFPGMVVEGIGTFLLVFAIIGVAVNPGGIRAWSGLVIGATLGLIVMVFGPLTGAGFNPARSFGAAVVGDFGGVGQFVLVYVLAPILGALLAAVVGRQLFIKPHRDVTPDEVGNGGTRAGGRRRLPPRPA